MPIISSPQSVQTQGLQAIAASNTTYSSGTATITGVGGGVTVSSNTGQRIDISVAAQSVQVVQSAIAASNTTYTSGLVTITGVGGGVTVSSNTGQRIDISVAAPVAQTVQTQNMVAISASNTLYTSGTVTITGSNMITVKSGAAQGVVIDATQSVQVVQSAIAASNTTYTSGLVVFTGSNMITVKSSAAGQTVVLDATQSVQIVQSAIAASNTTYTSGLVTITGVGGGVTVSSNTGQRVDISVAAPINFSGGVSNLGNTAGSTGVSGTRLVLVGSQNISLSQSTDANGATVTFSGGAGAGAFSAGASNLGNTAGATGVSGTRIVLVGTNNITLSQTTDAAGATISISGGAGGGGVNIAASNTTYTSGTVVFSASDGSRSAISVASVGAQSVIVSDAGPQLAWWQRGLPLSTNADQMGSDAGTKMTVFPLVDDGINRFPGRMTASIFRAFISQSQTATASISAALSSTMNVFIYTRTSDSLSLLNSGSMSFGNTVATSNNSTNWNGIKYIDITATSAWSSRPDFLYGGEYYVGVQFRSHITTGATRGRWVVIDAAGSLDFRQGVFSAASASTRNPIPFWGTVTLTATNHILTTIARSQVTHFSSMPNPFIMMYESTDLS